MESSDENKSVSVKRKLNVLTIEKKIEILEAVDKGGKKGQIAKDFKIPASTLSTILKNRKKIEDVFKQEKGAAKKIRIAGYPNLEECLIKWFKQCRNRNVPLGGNMLKEKAQQFAEKLGHKDFKGSNGWLENFKKRHNIIFRKLCGESQSVSNELCSEWITKLPDLLKDYSPDNIYNADETGLFFKALPDKTAVFKGDECHGGKQSKDRVTLLLAANMSGTDKLTPLMIGKSKSPRCFKGTKSFPLQYKANKKAWMTSELFADWLKQINRKMCQKKKKIILFIDNCRAHGIIPKMKAVKVVFLPPNATSKLQPLDQGIIRSFKVGYRKDVVKKIIDAVDRKKEIKPVNILDCMRMADRAWRHVTQKTIINCFRKAGFVKAEEKEIESDEDEEETSAEPTEPENDVVCDEWEKISKSFNLSKITFEDFAEIDADVEVCGLWTDEEIISQSVSSPPSDDEEEVDIPEPSPGVTVAQAKDAVNILRRFMECSENVENDDFAAIFQIEKLVDEQFRKRCHQATIPDFFKKF